MKEPTAEEIRAKNKWPDPDSAESNASQSHVDVRKESKNIFKFIITNKQKYILRAVLIIIAAVLIIFSIIALIFGMDRESVLTFLRLGMLINIAGAVIIYFIPVDKKK